MNHLRAVAALTGPLATVLLLLTGTNSIDAADLKHEVNRLWIQATDGAVRHRDMVAPGRDSLIAMGTAAIPHILPFLYTEDARERHAITDIFKGIGSAATPSLLAVLGKGGEYHTLNVLRAFGKIADSAATRGISALLNDLLASIRGGAAEAIGKSGGSLALASLYSVLHDHNETVRKSAVVGLGRIAEAQSVDSLIQALSDPWYGVRYPAALSVVNLDSGKTAIHYLSQLQDRPLCLLLHALGSAKSPDAARAVWTYTSHAQDGVRIEAAFALSNLATTTSDMARITTLLKTEKHPLVQYHYRRARIRINE